MSSQSLNFVDTLGVFRFFLRIANWKVWGITGLLIVASLSEGVGVAMLLPVLMIATGEMGDISPNSAQLIAAIENVGIPLQLEPLLVVMVVAIVGKTALRFLAMTRAEAVSASIGRDLRLQLMSALVGAKWSYFVRQSTGQLANTVSVDTNRIGSGVTAVIRFISEIALTLFYLAMAIWISWAVSIAALVVGCVTAFLMKLLVTRSRQAANTQALELRSMLGRLTDVLADLKSIKAMGALQSVMPELESKARRIARYRRREIAAAVGLRSVYEPILVVVVAIGIYAAIRWSQLSIAELFFAVALFQRVMSSIGSLQISFQVIARHQPNFAIVFETLAAAEEQAEQWDGREAVTFGNEIQLQKLSFAYKSKPVLSDLDLTIKAGELTTFFGPSGSGKTTCVDLICGLHRPDAGRILVDAVPLETISLADWRAQIGYVPQDPMLSNSDIASNVAVGDQDPDEDAVKHALDLADATTFVAAMSSGLVSPVGERGMGLSGGQRQRLAIARALYRRPRLLILDEATSALDPESEKEICSTLERLKGQVTMLAISHRPAIAEISDKVYRFAPIGPPDAQAGSEDARTDAADSGDKETVASIGSVK